jgi:hypothetical protein
MRLEARVARTTLLGVSLGLGACSPSGGTTGSTDSGVAALGRSDPATAADAAKTWSRAKASYSALVTRGADLIRRGDVVDVVPNDGAVVPGARVRLPAVANGAFMVRDVRSDAAVHVRLVGAHPSPGQETEGAFVYPHALEGGDVLHVPFRQGTEDWVLVDSKDVHTIAYDVSFEGIAGLRLLDDALEMLDEGGAPRLRVPAPFVSAAGKRHAARLSVEGCAYDTDPRPPWGRAVTRIGSDTCRVRVSWDESLGRPLLVDPAWTTTGSMATERLYHALVSLNPSSVTAKVVAIAGLGVGSVPATYSTLKTCEIYDPTSGTWAATGSHVDTLQYPQAALLPSGKIVAFGMDVANPETYDPTTGLWTKSTAAMAKARRNGYSVNVLASGKVLVAGGLDSFNALLATSELYDPVANTITPTGALKTGRFQHGNTVLGSGKVLAVGGYNNPSTYSTYLATTELYDPTAGTWAYGPDLPTPGSTGNSVMSVVKLSTGKALVVGGTNLPGWCLFDPTGAGSWSCGSSLPVPSYQSPVLALLTKDRWLMLNSLAVASIYDVASNTWLGSYVSGEYPGTSPSIVSLGSTTALVSGGQAGTYYTPIKNAQLYSFQALGGSCKYDRECDSLHCVDGVCCDTGTCSGCNACTAAMKGSGTDGTCGVIAKSTDPHAFCKDSGSPTCGLDGMCDGAGACEKYAVTTGCSPLGCSVGADCASGFCVDGICCDTACTGPCVACTAKMKGGGADGTCGSVAASTNPRGACAKDSGYPTSCKGDGLCDGAGACRAYAPKDTVCGAAVCTAGEAKGSLCDGAGKCGVSSALCAPFVCDSAGLGCLLACKSDSDCSDTTLYCEAGSCVAKKKDGSPASAGRECATGIVADGVCCNSACTGVCEACDKDGTKGTCTPVVDVPRHGTCPPPTGGDACKVTHCDGKDGSTCAGFAASEVVCGPAACTDGVSLAKVTCDGKGTCPAQAPIVCDPYKCDGDHCASKCTKDADCAKGKACDPSGRCVSGDTCDGDHTVAKVDGTKQDCSPFKCAGSICRTACVASSDCIAGLVCDIPTQKCVDPNAAAGTDAKSGCAHAGGSSEGGIGAFALVLALSVLARMRRRVA